MSIFKGRRFPVAIILPCMRWYRKDGISDRALAEMMQRRDATSGPSAIFRWAQRCALEIEKRGPRTTDIDPAHVE